MTTLRLILTLAVDIAGATTLTLLALWLLRVGIAWLRDWIQRPYIWLGRNRAVCRFMDDEDRQRTLAYFTRRGVEGKQLGNGQWHLLKRQMDFKPPPVRKKLPSVPVDTNPRRGID